MLGCASPPPILRIQTRTKAKEEPSAKCFILIYTIILRSQQKSAICTFPNIRFHMKSNVETSETLLLLIVARCPGSTAVRGASCCTGRTLPANTEFRVREAGNRGATDRKFHNNACPLPCTTSTSPFDSDERKGFCPPLPLFCSICTASSCAGACTWCGGWSEFSTPA